jgi:anti-sigma factor RsiW
MSESNDIPCREIVEIVTSYLEGALDEGLRARVDAHLAICPDCSRYVEQMRVTIELTGAALDPLTLSPELREGLERNFADWSPGSAG